MSLSQEVLEAGRHLHAATSTTLAELLNQAIRRFLGTPYQTASGCIVDCEGTNTEPFALVVYTANEGTAAPDAATISADTVAAVIDACESFDLERFRAAYARVAKAKRLKKAARPRPKGTAGTNATLGIVFALRSDLPFETLADELEKLNAQTPSREWPDMIAVASTGVINYAAQFPGESLSGDFMPPEDGALASYTPPIYVVTVMRPTGPYTFNKMASFLFAHLHYFSRDAKLPQWLEVLDGTTQTVVTLSGYQYNLKGELCPVPRQFHSDRYFPPPPYRIEGQKGDLLSTVQFLPWQDGGTIILKGKLPMEAMLVFIGKKAFERGGVVQRPPDVKISNIIPITQDDFNEMLKAFQRQSNMLVRSGEGDWVIQKVADEGTGSPFIARQLVGIMKLRDVIYPESAARDKFDKRYEFVNSALTNARTTAREITELWQGHVGRVTSGEIACLQGRSIRVDESIDKKLRKEVESFINAGVRALKQGMQELGNELQIDIGFMFKKQGAYEAGIESLRATDSALAEYLQQTRTWSEPLVASRNAIEHEGWTLPRIDYRSTGGTIAAIQPQISGQPFTEFVSFMLDRLCCFVEEFTAHALQRQMPAEITITEIPLANRESEMPLRFMLTPANGGLKPWRIAYHPSSFEDS